MQTGGSLFCCSRYELLEQFHTGPSQRTAKMMLESTFCILGITPTDALTLQHPMPDKNFLTLAQERTRCLLIKIYCMCLEEKR